MAQEGVQYVVETDVSDALSDFQTLGSQLKKVETNIEDSKDVDLKNNKTSKETLAKVKNVEGFKAKGNEAGVNSKEPKSEEKIVELKPNLLLKSDFSVFLGF